MPIFSGYWYTSVEYDGLDSCGGQIFKTYHDKEKGSVEEVAKHLLSGVPIHEYCEWSDIRLDRDSEHSPYDYPSWIDSYSDWNKTKSDPSAVVPMVARRECKNKEGEDLDFTSIRIEPSYVCPQGSIAGETGCDTHQSCYADLVARDLAWPVVSVFGHVGLSFANSFVIEVLKKSDDFPHDGIQVDYLDKFKHIAGYPYWGEKYGLVEKNTLTFDESGDIITKASLQDLYPFEYTMGWDWHPGSDGAQYIYNQSIHQWQLLNAVTAAKFRCDSFVYFAYLMGANLHIFPVFMFPFSPVDMFDFFVACRSFEGAKCVGASHPVKDINLLIQSVQLDSVFAAQKFNIRQADYSTYRFVKDEQISRYVKLNQLWSLAIKYQDNPDKFTYLIDCLDALKPIELTSEFIQNFQSQKNTENQQHLLIMMINSIQFHSQADLVEANNEIPNIIKIQNFMQDLLITSKNKEILRYVIQLYPSIVPPKQAQQDIEKTFGKKYMMNAESLLSGKDSALLKLRMAFSSQEQQRILLPSLITNDATSLFSHTTCFVLNEISPASIDDSVRDILRQHLMHNKQQLLSDNAQVLSKSQNIPLCNWLGAYAATMTHSDKEKDQFILTFIRNENDTLVLANLLSHLGWKLKSEFSHEEKQFYHSKLNEVLKNTRLSGSEKKMIMLGISSVAK